MKPLIILVATFVASLLIAKIFTGQGAYFLSGRIALSTMLIFTAVGHFVYSKGMTLMIPAFIPFKKGLVFLTGIIEILAAVGLLLTRLQHTTGWLLIIFFILILPANVNAAMKKVDYQKGTTDGTGVSYLWFRVPLQLIFIAWVHFFAIIH
jgi:uncharacterized membrane protein